MWGSPVDANWGWKQWCENEEFHTDTITEDNSFKWRLSDEAKVLYIEDMEDLDKIKFVSHKPFCSLNIDFSDIIKNYDAMEICMDKFYFGHMFINEKELCFNCWDCDSIMVFNRDVIVPL